MSAPILTMENVNGYYGQVQVLHGFNLQIVAGEVLCLFGRNGAGKSSILKTIMGLLPARSGQIHFDGIEITGLPAHEVPRRGIALVPQGRRLFAELTVAENIEIGLLARATKNTVREKVLDLFPVLRERLKQAAGTLSGGEQQMLALARALCLEPRLLLLDEPTEGLMPSMIALIQETVCALRDDGVSILLVEQRMDAVLPIADRAILVENGRNGETIDMDRLRDDPAVARRLLGVG